MKCADYKEILKKQVNWTIIFRDCDFFRIFEKIDKIWNFEKVIFSIFLNNFLLKSPKKRKKAKNFFRERPAR